MKKQFSYAALLKKVKKNGKTGFYITITDTVTLLPVNTAVINIVQGAKTVPANKRGVMDVKLTEGIYNYTITAPGYTPVEGVLSTIAGVMQRIKIAMSKVSNNIEVA